MSWNPYYVSKRFESHYRLPKGSSVADNQDTYCFNRWGREFWASLPARKTSSGRDMGKLTLSWHDVDGSRPELSVQWNSWNGFYKREIRQVHKLNASVECSPSNLLEPIHWQLEEQTFIDDEPVGAFRYREKGSVEGRAIVRNTEGMPKPFPAQSLSQNRVTCDWMLFTQLAKYLENEVETLNFDLFEGMALLRKDQVLRYRGQSLVSVGDYKLNLHEYEQQGMGNFNTTYWFDEGFRPLFIVSGCCYLYYLESITQS